VGAGKNYGITQITLFQSILKRDSIRMGIGGWAGIGKVWIFHGGR